MGGGQSDSRQALVKLKIPSQELCFTKCYLRTKEKPCILLIWGRSIRVKNHCQVGGTTKFKGATKGWRNNYWVKGHNRGGRIKGNMGVRGTKLQELSVERWGPTGHSQGHQHPDQTPVSPSFLQWGALQWFSNSWELSLQLQLFSWTHTLGNHYYRLHSLNRPCFSSLEAVA